MADTFDIPIETDISNSLEETIEVGENPVEFTSKENEVLSDFYAHALDRPASEVWFDLEAGMHGVLKAEANDKANVSNTSRATEKVEKGLQGEEVDLLDIQQGFQFNEYVSPDLAYMLNERDTFNETEKRILDRRLSAERIISNKINKRSEGLLATAGYFIDTAASSVVHNVGGAVPDLLGIEQDTLESGSELRKLAEEASMLYVADIPPQEFERRLTEILDRVADAGLFSEENPFYLTTFLEMVDEVGAGWNSDMEVLFQFLDVASLGTAGVARATVDSGRRFKTISQLADATTAKDIVVRSGDAGVDSSLLSEGTSSAMLRSDDGYYTAPELDARRDLEANNELLKAFKRIDFGPFVDPAIVEAKKAEWLDTTRDLNKRYKRREVDYSIRVDDFGNIFGVAYLGKAGGKPYKTIEGARKYADSIGGDIVEQLHEGETSWVVKKEWGVPTEGLTKETDVKNLASGFFSGIMSTTAKTTPQLDAILKQGEAKTSLAVRELAREYKKVKKAVRHSDRQNVDGILLELRDDPLKNHRKEPYSSEEFSTRYEEKYGIQPTPETVEYYDKLIELNDIDYFINADRLLKEAINDGEEMVKVGGVFFRSKVSKEVSSGDSVFNLDTSRVVDFDDINPEATIRVLDDPYEVEGVGFVRYVVGDSPVLRRLYHSDVLPYNVGGHRTYNTPSFFFLKQRSELKLAGGKEVEGRPKTFMGVRFEDQANLARDQFNTVVDAVKRGATTPELNRIVLSNNTWNTSIEDFDDFKVFASEHGLDISKTVDAVPDGEAIDGGFVNAKTQGDVFRSGLNASKRRGTRPLVGFGGDELDVLDPTKAVERGFAQTIARRGDMNYLFNSINGWVKAAESQKAITNAGMLTGLSPKAKLEAAVLSKNKIGKALSRERETIKQRMSNTTALVAAERNLFRSMAEFTYGKGYEKIAKSLDWVSTKDPAGFLRAMAFHTKLGLFNVQQLYVQANQIINVVGVTSATIGPVGAVRGALGVAPLRLLLIDAIPDGAKRLIAKGQAPFTGITEDEIINLADWVKKSGRNVIDRTVVEENNSVAFLGSPVLDWGQVFFKEGELSARLAAATTNFLERKAKGFDEDIFDPAVTRSMIHRQDVLTASMTSASAAPWQRSLAAVPLQFTTYHLRMMEQIFTDRILTKSERISLLLSHLVFYGAAAVPGAGFVADRLAFEGDVDIEDPMFDLVRYGTLDASLTLLSGEETALSTRLAAGEGLWDLIYKLAQEPLPTIMAGPGGTITLDSLDAAQKLVRNLGSFDHLTYDWNRLARNVSTYNSAYVFWMARQYGMMVSRKSEATQITNMSEVESWLVAAGVPLQKTDLVWSSVSNLQSEKAQFERHIKEVLRLDNIITREMQSKEPDWEHVGNLLDDLGGMLEILSPSDKSKARRRLKQNGQIAPSIVRTLIRTGHTDVANKLKELIDG